MAINVQAIGNSSQGIGASPISIAVTSPGAGVGDCVVVVASCAGSDVATITDNATGGTNVYTALTAVTGGTGTLQAFYSVLARALPAAKQITITSTNVTNNRRGGAVVVTGATATPLDLNPAGASGTGTHPAYSDGTNSNSIEAVVGFADEATANAVWTEDGAYTHLISVIYGGRLNVAFKVTASIATQTYSPVLATSQAFNINLASFIQSGGGAAATPGDTLSMMGV